MELHNFKDRIGESMLMKNGLWATIIAYRRNDDIDVQFENGVIIKRAQYSQFIRKCIMCPPQFIEQENYCKVTCHSSRTNSVTEFFIDKDDIDLVNGKLWHISDDGYVVSKGKNSLVRLHRLITDAKTGYEVDHINNNKMDNRKCNLRICTRRENSYNRSLSRNNTSGYKGVSWNKRIQRWGADIQHNGNHISLGSHGTKEQAARAYNKAAIMCFGEFAKLNEVAI